MKRPNTISTGPRGPTRLSAASFRVRAGGGTIPAQNNFCCCERASSDWWAHTSARLSIIFLRRHFVLSFIRLYWVRWSAIAGPRVASRPAAEPRWLGRETGHNTQGNPLKVWLFWRDLVFPDRFSRIYQKHQCRAAWFLWARLGFSGALWFFWVQAAKTGRIRHLPSRSDGFHVQSPRITGGSISR